MAGRRVRHLRLYAEREEEVEPAAEALQAALAAAYVPDQGSGRVLIRRLDVGRFRAGLPLPQLRIIIERRIGACIRGAVPLDHPHAELAEAVRIADDVEAPIQLVRRLARREPVRGWPWQSAVPGLRPHLTPQELVKLAVRQALQSKAASLALERMLSDLARHGRSELLLDTLLPTDLPPPPLEFAREVRRETTGKRSSEESSATDVAWVERMVHSEWAGPIRDCLRRWGKNDPRTLWVGLTAVRTTLRRSERYRASAMVTQLLSRSSAAVGAPLEAPSTGIEKGEPTPANGKNEREMTSPRGEPAEVYPPTRSQPASPKTSPNEPSMKQLARQTGPVPRGTSSEYSLSVDKRETEAGGLFYLVAVMQCLGISDVSPEELPGLGWAVLTALVPDEVPSDDPMRSLVTDESAIWQPPQTHFVAPQLWWPKPSEQMDLVERPASSGDAPGKPQRLASLWSGQQLLAAWAGARPTIHREDRNDPLHGQGISSLSEATSIAWRTAITSWLAQRLPALTLEQVILRPARLNHTPTHVDVFFTLDQADISIRRAALDIDPGYVEWLGRVVSFFYQ